MSKGRNLDDVWIVIKYFISFTKLRLLRKEMSKRGSKRTVICISSSSDDDIFCGDDEEESVEYDDEDDGVGDSEEEFHDEDDGDVNSEEDDDEGESGEEFDDEESDNGCDEGVLSKRVIRFLKENKNLDSLTLNDCKAYLRENRLRIAGTKAVCIQRVKEHWRLKDGNGEVQYPRSSFVVNCTGDVCRGDTVLFTQKVYAKFDKVTRHGGLIGKRTVAGRVVKESYGASKQQHTFTLWNDEAERVQVLAEKHRRGAAARDLRAMQKKKRKIIQTKGCAKNQGHVHLARQPLKSKEKRQRMPSRDNNNAVRRHSTYPPIRF
ncbi:zinc finger CCCH domain-containing protein 62-like isoform X4 [Cucumis melo]|uniref:Zinc finger CCCH domain-containing protein 62-like isoform X4 n=1 Tax=Cucumis melo TaxID=3656 RepID=A0ABM3KC33_CUCME|nr:zinc finger CCCH domain-containing protein 62-like isoform X4 [Cucumis melo]